MGPDVAGPAAKRDPEHGTYGEKNEGGDQDSADRPGVQAEPRQARGEAILSVPVNHAPALAQARAAVEPRRREASGAGDELETDDPGEDQADTEEAQGCRGLSE